MVLGPVLAFLAACCNRKRVFCLFSILSLLVVCIAVLQHEELMATMDVLSVTTDEISFQPASYLQAALSGLAINTVTPRDSSYDWQRSTEENYRSDHLSNESGDGFVGEFKDFRRRLDRSYHNDYFPERQALQDSIIRTILSRTDKNCEEQPSLSALDNECERIEQGIPEKQKDPSSKEDQWAAHWIVFTAGVYGAGKSHTLEKLQAVGCFPPSTSFVGVDPDEIRRLLPEFSLYSSDQAGEYTQKEAGMIAELLTDIALSSGKNVVVDGSLRDAAWHKDYFQKLRFRFGKHSQQQEHKAETKNLRIGILYVTAPVDEIYKRVEQRGTSTGRAVPPEFLERSMREVPEAIERLRPLADFFLHVHNSQSNVQGKDLLKGVSGQDSENKQDSFSSLMSVVPPNKGQVRLLANGEIESSIFQEKCRSIVGY